MDEVPSLHRDVFCLLIVYTEYVWLSSESLILPHWWDLDVSIWSLVDLVCGLSNLSLWCIKYFFPVHLHIASIHGLLSSDSSRRRPISISFAFAFCPGLWNLWYLVYMDSYIRRAEAAMIFRNTVLTCFVNVECGSWHQYIYWMIMYLAWNMAWYCRDHESGSCLLYLFILLKHYCIYPSSIDPQW
jgi:hypothetical protein